MSLCLFSTSLNTEAFVNRVDPPHRAALYLTVKSNSRTRRAVVGHGLLHSLASGTEQLYVPSSHWTGSVTVQCTSCAARRCNLCTVVCMVSTPHALSQIQHGKWDWTRRLRSTSHLASSDFQQCVKTDRLIDLYGPRFATPGWFDHC